MENELPSATLENHSIVIRVPVSYLACALENVDATFEIVSLDGFTEDILSEINLEEEDGTTLIHELLDQAIVNAIDNGSEHVKGTEDDEE